VGAADQTSRAEIGSNPGDEICRRSPCRCRGSTRRVGDRRREVVAVKSHGADRGVVDRGGAARDPGHVVACPQGAESCAGEGEFDRSGIGRVGADDASKPGDRIRTRSFTVVVEYAFLRIEQGGSATGCGPASVVARRRRPASFEARTSKYRPWTRAGTSRASRSWSSRCGTRSARRRRRGRWVGVAHEPRPGGPESTGCGVGIEARGRAGDDLA